MRKRYNELELLDSLYDVARSIKNFFIYKKTNKVFIDDLAEYLVQNCELNKNAPGFDTRINIYGMRERILKLVHLEGLKYLDIIGIEKDMHGKDRKTYIKISSTQDLTIKRMEEAINVEVGEFVESWGLEDVTDRERNSDGNVEFHID